MQARRCSTRWVLTALAGLSSLTLSVSIPRGEASTLVGRREAGADQLPPGELPRKAAAAGSRSQPTLDLPRRCLPLKCFDDLKPPCTAEELFALP